MNKEHDKELLLLQLKQRLLAQGIRPQIVATAKIIKITDTYILFGMWKFQGVLKMGRKCMGVYEALKEVVEENYFN